MPKKPNSPNVVHGQHQSLALAERHLRELGPRWKISSRRNSSGELSPRGHFFTFRKRPRKKKAPPRKTEYQINVKYGEARAKSVEVQIAAFGPINQTRERIIEAIDYYIDPETDGENLKGWTVRIIFWEKHGKQFFGTDELARQALRWFFHEGEIDVYDKTKAKFL